MKMKLMKKMKMIIIKLIIKIMKLDMNKIKMKKNIVVMI